MSVITAVGHADLTVPTLELVEAELKERLARLTEGAGALVRAGAGLPLAFGRAAREASRSLVVLLPTQRSVPALLPEPDRAAAAELLMLAEHVRLLGFDPADRDARVGADERLVAESRKVLAVWDGSPTDGRDATGHLVAYARARGIPVEVIWPRVRRGWRCLPSLNSPSRNLVCRGAGTSRRPAAGSPPFRSSSGRRRMR